MTDLTHVRQPPLSCMQRAPSGWVGRALRCAPSFADAWPFALRCAPSGASDCAAGKGLPALPSRSRIQAFQPVRSTPMLASAMTHGLLPAHDFPIATLASMFTRSYEGYIAGSFTLDPATFAQFVSHHGVDLWLSRIAVRDGAPVGFGYVNRTGDIARLASLGVVPEARRSGVARNLVSSLLAESHARGETEMSLEVIEQNPTAVELYRSLGFETIGRLFGWRLPIGFPPYPVEPDADAGATEIPLLTAIQTPSSTDYPDLPWQVSRHSAAKAPPGARAFTSSHARVVFSDPEDEPIRVLAMFTDLQNKAGWDALRRLLSAVIPLFPNRTWWTPAVFPECHGHEVFQPLGFTEEPLRQFLMRRQFRKG